MIDMKALVGFTDSDIASETIPTGGVAANQAFKAPSAEIAKRLADAGLAERVKTPAGDKA